MVSKNLYIAIIFRVVILTGTAIGFSFLIVKNQIGLAIFIGLSLVLQIVFLIQYLNTTNRKIAYFFDAINNEDSSIYFPEKMKNTSIKELNKSLNRVNHLIQKVKIENQHQEQFYQTILEQAAVGILTVNEKGHIIVANETVKKILNYESLTHIEQLRKIDDKLYALISRLSPFQQQLILIPNEREHVALTVKASSIKLNHEKFLLVVIQDIKNELESKEIDSWIGLIRVLTHEIMNSIAPITSLSETLSKIFYKENQLISPEYLQAKDIQNTAKGLAVIQSQGNSLINFVSSYRSLTKIPKPDKELLSVLAIFDKIRILVSQEDGFDNVKFVLEINPKNLEVFADEKQLVQVLINLVKNAMQSLHQQSDGTIKLSARRNTFEKVILSISDNGPGISDQLTTQIFIPFFTTKEKGTGIGLSLSKHIMRLHQGNIQVQSIPHQQTTFTLKFP
ncbi:MAG: histidine kinase [Flavobacteriaceae bacterium]|nr:MAG: histidine kinase [Flavobacteriaceae bacterium]